MSRDIVAWQEASESPLTRRHTASDIIKGKAKRGSITLHEDHDLPLKHESTNTQLERSLWKPLPRAPTALDNFEKISDSDPHKDIISDDVAWHLNDKRVEQLVAITETEHNAVLSELLLFHSSRQCGPISNIRQTAHRVRAHVYRDMMKHHPLRANTTSHVSSGNLKYGTVNGGIVIMIRPRSRASEETAETGSTITECSAENDTASHTSICTSPILGCKMTRRVIDRKRFLSGHGNPFYSRGTRYRPDAEEEHIAYKRPVF